MKASSFGNLFHVAKFLILAAIACLTVVAANIWFSDNSDSLHIAILAPTSGPSASSGKEMLQGAQMYIDRVNKKGGIEGKKIKLENYDDGGNEHIGRQKAQEIAENDKILLALGSYSSSVSIIAGEIYQKYDLPAITAISEASQVTQDNNVYFRATFNTNDQGAFLASYIKKILKRDTVSIIFDKSDKFSKALATSFRNNFQGLTGQVKNDFNIQKYSQGQKFSPSAFLSKKLLTLKPENIGTIVLLTQAKESAQIVANIKRAGIQAPIMGGTPLFEKTFLEELKKYPEAEAQPGYFSDNIYATSPLIYDVSGEQTQAFYSEFEKLYEKEPTWLGAMSYESAKIAVEAIKRAQVVENRENRTIRQNRQAVRQALSKMRNIEQGVDGLDRQLYFNRDRNTPRAIAMGKYKKQKFISAPIQLLPIFNLDAVDRLEEKRQQGEILRFGGKYAYVTQVVYTGIDINEISRLDLKKGTYVVDLFLWFRYQKNPDFDLENIEFLNAKKTINLDNPIDKNISDSGNTIVRTFRVKTKFEADFNFRNYPFDVQKLGIKFRHANRPRKNIIYVADIVGMNSSNTENLEEKFKRSEVLANLDNWEFKTAKFFESISKDYSSLGNIDRVDLDSGIKYSQFNAIVEIERLSLSFSINKLLPLAFFIWILYLFLFFPLHNFSAEAVSGSLLGVVFFHIGLKSELAVGYIIVLDVIFYIIYGLITTQIVLVTIVVKFRDNEKNQKKLKGFVRVFRFIFPLYIIVATLTVANQYNIISMQNESSTAETQETQVQTKSQNQKQANKQTILTLGNWHPLDEKEFQNIYKVYYQEHPEVQLKTISTPYLQYGDSLNTKLKNESAPDIIFLRPYTLDRDLFYQGYLASLNELPGLKENYPDKFIDPWETEKGDTYGIPLGGVVHGIFYNVDLFARLGLQIPQTWEDLLYTAQQIKMAGILPFANSVGNAQNELDNRLFTTLVPNFTGGREGRQAYEEGNRCFNDAGIVATFEAISQLRPYLNPQDLSLLQSTKRFLIGKAAMWIGGSWELKAFTRENPDFEWRAFAVPPPSGKPGYTVFHPNFAAGLNANSPHQQEAKQFLQWLTTPEAAEILTTQLVGRFPLHKEKPEIENPHAQTFFSFLQDQETDVRWTYPQLHTKIPGGHTLTKEAVAKIMKGEITPQEAADRLQRGLAEWYEPAQICGQTDRNG